MLLLRRPDESWAAPQAHITAAGPSIWVPVPLQPKTYPHQKMTQPTPNPPGPAVPFRYSSRRQTGGGCNAWTEHVGTQLPIRHPGHTFNFSIPMIQDVWVWAPAEDATVFLCHKRTLLTSLQLSLVLQITTLEFGSSTSFQSISQATYLVCISSFCLKGCYGQQ